VIRGLFKGAPSENLGDQGVLQEGFANHRPIGVY
jgi:hypothetical protein